MIPKTLHLYWGRNRPLSFLRYLTVLTFKCHNPSWEVVVWYPTAPCRSISWETGEHRDAMESGPDWFESLGSIGVKLLEVPWGEDYCNLPEVHRSDLLRWRLLHSPGGFWSDFDILWVKPMEEFGGEVEAILFPYQDFRRRKIYPIGFLGGVGEALWPQVERRALLLAGRADRYQALGRECLEVVLRTRSLSEKILEADPNLVYPYRREDDWSIFWKTRTLNLPIQTIGVHWYAGHRGPIFWEKMLTGPDALMKYGHLALPQLAICSMRRST